MGAATGSRKPKATTKVNEPKLGPDEVGQGDDGVWWVPLDRIVPFADQPRKEFDEQELASLARGIAAVGQKNPGQLRELQAGRDPRYELVDGERRWRACRLAGKTHFRAILVTVSREEQYVDSVTLNFGRSAHSPGEVLEIILNLKRMKKTNAEIAAILGVSDGFVNQYLELSRLDPQIRVLLGPPTPLEERIAVTVARTLTELEPKDQLTAWRELCRGDVTMRRARMIVQQMLSSGAQRNSDIRARTRKPSDVVRLVEGRLRSILELLSTLAEDPLLSVLQEAEWKQHRTDALQELEDIIADAEDLRDKLSGEDPLKRKAKDKKPKKGGKAQQPEESDPTHERDRARKRLLKALETMAETTFELSHDPHFDAMFVGQPFSVVGYARLSVTELVRQLARLDQKLPEADDIHRYDPAAKLLSDEPEPEAAVPSDEEPVYDVDPSQAPDPVAKKRKKKPAR